MKKKTEFKYAIYKEYYVTKKFNKNNKFKFEKFKISDISK
jgi:hypothetical protein